MHDGTSLSDFSSKVDINQTLKIQIFTLEGINAVMKIEKRPTLSYISITEMGEINARWCVFNPYSSPCMIYALPIPKEDLKDSFSFGFHLKKVPLSFEATRRTFFIFTTRNKGSKVHSLLRKKGTSAYKESLK